MYLDLSSDALLLSLTVELSSAGVPGGGVNFSPSSSYDRVRIVLEEIGWLVNGNAGNNYIGTCKHTADLYKAIGCQEVCMALLNACCPDMRQNYRRCKIN